MIQRDASADDAERQHIADQPAVIFISSHTEQNDLGIHKNPLKPAQLAGLESQHLAKIEASPDRNERDNPSHIHSVLLYHLALLTLLRFVDRRLQLGIIVGIFEFLPVDEQRRRAAYTVLISKGIMLIDFFLIRFGSNILLKLIEIDRQSFLAG